MKLYCTDCKWRRTFFGPIPPICEHEEGRDPTGLRRHSLHYMRREYGPCGPDGKFWEPNRSKVPWWRRKKRA